MDSPRSIDSPRDLPKVSRNQQRPKPHVLCADCEDQIPFDDGNNTGTCNCGRICYEHQSTCHLSVYNNGCAAAAYPGDCASCGTTAGCGW
jgi:hypothetical protein